MPDPITCAVFDDQVDELVLDLLDPATRDALLHHADACARCRTELRSLAEVADILSTAAHECEPPVGFDARVLEALAASSTASPTGVATTRRRREFGRARTPASRIVVATLAAAAAALVVGSVGVLIGRSTVDPAPAAAPSTQPPAPATTVSIGSLLGPDRTDHGWVLLEGNADGGSLTMHVTGLPAGDYQCVLHTSDGSSRVIASWAVDDTGSGHWVLPLQSVPDTERITMVSTGDSAGLDEVTAELERVGV